MIIDFAIGLYVGVFGTLFTMGMLTVAKDKEEQIKGVEELNRLTNTSVDSRNSNAVRIFSDTQTALKKLKEYEDTGLEPNQIYNLMKATKLKSYGLPIPEGYVEISKVFCIDKIKQLGIEVELVTAVYVGKGEMVITGIPDSDDETHNCDEMGCSTLNHVLYRENL